MPKKILIVENEVEMRKLEKDILEPAGYDVLEADNSHDAIKLAMEEKPDLILMDIRLPHKKRGIGTAKFLRLQEETKNIPIIFVSVYTEYKESNEVTYIENHGFIEKPFKVQEFKEYVTNFLK